MNNPLQAIQELFDNNVDHARAVGPLTPAGRALLLLATLRFFAAVGTHSEQEDLWYRFRTQRAYFPSPQEIQSSLHALTHEIEKRRPQLERVFTDLLLPSLRGVEDLLITWIAELGKLGSSLRENATPFARWFDSVVDYTIGRGVSGLQYTTPRAIADLMVDLGAPQPGESVHDPCSGSGGLLATTLLHLESQANSCSLSGQEANAEMADLARLRLELLDANGARIRTGDVFRKPLFTEGDRLETFDVVLCDPPYGQRLANNDFAESDPYGRFRHGRPGRTSSEVAFLQHAVACLNETGRAVILLAHGPLFRGGGDAVVRANIIKEDLIEMVIGLPVGVLPGVSTEFALIVCRRTKPGSHKGHVLFVDGSEERDALRDPNGWKAFTRTISSYDEALRNSHLSSRVPISKIEKNGFSLQPRRYVLRERQSESVDIKHSLAQAAACEKEAAEHAMQIDRLIEDIEKSATGGFA
jgi:type I restriction enzyme M protein